VTCILASSRCAGWDGDCRTLPHDLVPHGVSWWRTCARFPWSPVADAAWHLAKEAAVSAWVSARHLPALWAIRHVTALDREALAHASTATWLEGEGMRDCQRA